MEKHMNCGDFKAVFSGRTILALVIEEHTFIYRFKTEFITYFLRTFLHFQMPLWKAVYFYDIGSADLPESHETDGKKIIDKARFLKLIARCEDQTGGECVFKKAPMAPDTKKLEGKRSLVITIDGKLKEKPW